MKTSGSCSVRHSLLLADDVLENPTELPGDAHAPFAGTMAAALHDEQLVRHALRFQGIGQVAIDRKPGGATLGRVHCTRVRRAATACRQPLGKRTEDIATADSGGPSNRTCVTELYLLDVRIVLAGATGIRAKTLPTQAGETRDAGAAADALRDDVRPHPDRVE